MSLIRHLAEDRAIGLVEHKMGVVMEVSDQVCVLHQGEMLAEGSPADIQRNARVREVYLGGGRQGVSA